MAACRLGRSAIKAGQGFLRQASTSSANGSRTLSLGSKQLGSLGGAGLCAGLFLGGQLFADEFGIHPPNLPWSHDGFLRSMDHRAIRRGFQVYIQVCSACHSIDQLYWRQLSNVAYTEKEVKKMAVQYEYEDGPDEEGNMFMRPGKAADAMPAPYKNEKEARFKNNGALPPDFTTIAKARHGGIDYIFHLLTGYYDPPEGVELMEGTYFNAYFPGHATSMAQALYPGVMSYEEGDDTPVTVSQMAKDVTEFLAWTAEPWHDQRKRILPKFSVALGFFTLGYWMFWRRYNSMSYSKRVFRVELPKRK